MITVGKWKLRWNGCAEWCHVWLPRCGAVGLNVDLVQTSAFLASHLPPHHCSSRNPGRARCLCFTLSAYGGGLGLVSFETRPEVMIWWWLQTCMSLQFVGQDLVAEAIDSLQSCYCDGCARPALEQLCTYHHVLLLCKGSPILRLRE